MYCKYCGTEISEYDTFCRHCGRPQSENHFIDNKPLSLFCWFKSIKPKYQKLILSFILYILLWIAAILIHYIEHRPDIDGFLVSFFIFGIIIPYIIVWIMFANSKGARFNNKVVQTATNETTNVYSSKKIAANSSDAIVSQPGAEYKQKAVVKTTALLEFARMYGKMQIVQEPDKIYCLFVPENGINSIKQVSFSANIGIISAEEIRHRKYSLCVKEYDDCTFELDSI